MKAVIVFSSKNIAIDGRNIEDVIKEETENTIANIKTNNKDADISGVEKQIRLRITSKYSAEKLFLKALLTSALVKTNDIYELAAIVNYAKSLNECNDRWTIQMEDMDKYLKKSLDKCQKESWWLYLDSIISQLISPKFDEGAIK